MCGIAGIYLKDPQQAGLPTNEVREAFINELLKGIEHRGRDATGVVALQRGSTQPHMEKADIDASEFIKWRRPLPLDSRIVLLHTRAATKGSPKNLDNNHPVVHKTCYVTHNGHIRNDDDLFKDNVLDRIAQVDSEIIPALIDKHGLDKVHLALQELEGGFAIAAVQPETHPDLLVLAKGHNSPLEFIETEQAIVWASTTTTIREAWRKAFGSEVQLAEIQTLHEGELLYIEDGKVEKLKFEVKQPKYTPTYSNYGSYSGGWMQSDFTHESYLERFTTASNHRRVCTCKHSQWKHSQKDMTGWCIKSGCDCIRFEYDRYLNKREWKQHEDYKRVQEDRKKLAELRAEHKKQVREQQQRIKAARERTAAKDYRAEFPGIKGQLRLLYAKGERRVFDDGVLVAIQFKCDGCEDWQTTEGRIKQGGYALCIECWGEECDLCQEFFSPTQLSLIDAGTSVKPNDWYVCDTCYNTLNTATEDEFEDAVANTEGVEECEVPAALVVGTPKGVLEGLTVDNMCIKLTADELECKASFLYELLFEFTEQEIKAESWLDQAYQVSKTCYKKNLSELRQGLVSATSKALALRGSEDYTRPPARSVGEAANSVESEVGVRVFMDE